MLALRRVYVDFETAGRCCVCQTCGREGTGNGLVECVDCQRERVDKRERARWEKARKTPLSQCPSDEVYVELLEKYVEADHNAIWDAWLEVQYPDAPDMPPYDELRVYATREESAGVIAADAVYEQICEDSYEDYQMSDEAYADLHGMCASWNEKWGEKMYVPDYGTAITEG